MWQLERRNHPYPKFLFGFRNTNTFAVQLTDSSGTILSTDEGEGSEAERLPELRRYRICCEAGGHERKV